jgi:hypothetical protein
MVEMSKRMDPSGRTAAIVEVLQEDNPIIQDATWMEANDVWANKTTRRAYLPSGDWRKLNNGVSKVSTLTVVLWDTIGSLEAYSEPDKDLIDKAPDPMQARMDEARGIIEGMSVQFAYSMFYKNADSTPEAMTGLHPRMPSLATTTNVLNAGGSGSDVTSVYVVMWGPGKVNCIYPKGAPNMGVQHRDLGEQTLSGTSSTQYQGYRDHFKLEAGLAVQDEKCIGRVANIESTGATNLFDEDDLITLCNRMRNGPKWVYVNNTVLTQMEIALKDKNNVNFTPSQGEGLAGAPVMYFRGYPVKKCDQIAITETALT